MVSIDAWKARGAYKAILGRSIFTIDEGEAKKGTLLLIHGFPTASWDFCKMWDGLTADYRVIALDMLGFGLSDKPEDHTYSIMEQADIAEAVVTEFGLTSFHVLAHDYGDTVAQELLARQNSGTGAGDWQSVCFLNGGLFPETHKALFIQKLLLSPVGKWVNKLTTRKRFDVSVSRTFGPETKPSTAELDAFWALVNYNEGRHIFHNLIAYMSDRKTHRARWLSALQQAAMPIGLINGSFDPVSGAHMVARYKEVVGDPAYLKEFTNIGHYPQVEAPEAVLAAYLEFLEQTA